MTNRATSGRRGKRTARLPSITEAQRQKIRAALCLGAGRESAAACARVPWAVFREWMARGEAQGRGQFHDFAMDVKQAEATAEVRDLAQLQPRPARDPRTAWPLLESRFPERWAKPPGR